MAKITITDSGQTTTLNEANNPETPDDGLQRIVTVYFAKKVVTQNGSNVAFTRIDSLNNDGQDFDRILGQTVYLIIETNNMRALEIDAIVKPSTTSLTGNTDSLALMKFNPQGAAGSEYVASTLLTAEVGNFDALNNRDGSHAHYTNLETSHADKAIIKLQLRPATSAVFNNWATNLGVNTGNLEIIVERHDKQACAFRTSTEEITGAETFLNSDAVGRFRVVNRNLYEVYARVFVARTGNRNTYTDALYNFLPLNGTVRKRISKIENANSTKVSYYYYDQYDNEMLIANCDKTIVMGRNNGRQIGAVPPNAIRKESAPAGGNAQFNYIFPTSIVTTGNHKNGGTARSFPGKNRIVRYDASGTNVPLIRMPDSLNVNRNNVIIAYGFSGTQRRFCKPECFAGFIGVLAQYGLAGVNSTGMCFGDATSYPSLAHPNGDSVDTSYLANQGNQQNLLNAFVDWNFTQVIAGVTQSTWLRNAHSYAADHNDHLHSGDFDSNSIHSII
jgi:hypothetical protein